MQINEYSKFDQEGIPTHNKNGEPLSENDINGLKKLFKSHDKKHNEWLAKQTKK